MELCVGKEIELLIGSLAFGGRGVAKHEGRVVFVPAVAPGEQVRARIVRMRASYAEAALVEVLNPSPARVEPKCPLAGRCPGCAYQHLAYDAELDAKSAQLRDLMARVGHVEAVRLGQHVPAPNMLGYRNKIVLHAGTEDIAGPVLGYADPDTGRVFDVSACPLALDPINALLSDLRVQPGFLSRLQPRTAVTLRHTERDGALFWIGPARRQDAWLAEQTPAGELLVPRESFFQVNPAVAALLADTVAAAVKEVAPATVYDLYCGVGVFVFLAAQAGVPEVKGVDTDPRAIRAARYNARRQGLTALQFERMDAATALRTWASESAPDRSMVVLDPPRTGLDPLVVETLRAMGPARVLYISCAADTLARDLSRLTPAGYVLEEIRMFDMFPRTSHFECVAKLRR